MRKDLVITEDDRYATGKLCSWCSFSRAPDFGDNGDTVDLNDTPYDQVMERTIYESAQGQNMYSTAINEDPLELSNLSLLKGTAPNPESAQFAINACIMISTRKFKYELEILARDKFKPNSDALKGFENLINFIHESFLSGKREILENSQKSLGQPLTVDTIDRNGNTSNYEKTSKEHRGNQENLLSPTFQPKADVNMNVPEMILIDYTTPSDTDLPHNGVIDNGRSNNSGQINNGLSTTSDSAIAHEISSGHLKDLMDLNLSPRTKFENTLTESAKNFFSRVEASSKLEKPPSCKLRHTNPFKSDLSGRTTPTLAGAPTVAPIVAQPRITYESGPVMYENDKEKHSSSNRNDRISEFAREEERLLEAKRINVESWIEHSYSPSDRFTNDPRSTSIAPRTTSAPKATTCNGTKFNGGMSNLSRTVTPTEWLEAIENTISFKSGSVTSHNKKKSPGNDKAAIQNQKHLGATNGTPARVPDKSSSFEYSVKRNTPVLETSITHDTREREMCNVKAIQISNRVVYLIIYENDGWIAIDEFADAFTNKPSGAMQQILNIQGVKIPFLKIGRTHNSALFNELDRTSVSVSRDYQNKIGDSLTLVPLKSALKILRKLKILEQEQIEQAMKYKIFPKDSDALFDIWTVINTWGEIQKSLQLIK